MCLVSFIPTNTSPLTFFIAILDGLCGWKSGALTLFPSIANCSSGSYYNTEKDACDKCAIGAYQPGQGQKECISCGENLTTLLKGMEKELDCIGKLSIYLYRYISLLVA